jgi:tripartite-type tricarboxylate transporter receptor subunit TctC
MAINDLIAGHVQVMWESLNTISSYARSGKVRALAVSSAERSAAFPDLPTIAEAGVPGYEASTWTGIPAGLPRPVLERLNAALNEAIRTPVFRDRFALIGDEPGGGTPEDYAEAIRRDSVRWAEVIRRSGAKID